MRYLSIFALLIVFVGISRVDAQEFSVNDDGNLVKTEVISTEAAQKQCAGLQQSIDTYQAKIDELAQQRQGCQLAIDQAIQVKADEKAAAASLSVNTGKTNWEDNP